jgi:hypothetical protein
LHEEAGEAVIGITDTVVGLQDNRFMPVRPEGDIMGLRGQPFLLLFAPLLLLSMASGAAAIHVEKW